MRSEVRARVLTSIAVAGLIVGCSRHPASSLLGSVDRASVAGPGSTLAAIGDDADRKSHDPTASAGIPPTVQITSPTPNHLFAPSLPTTCTIRFAGDDPDARSHRPLEYRYHLFSESDPFDFFEVLVDPDSLRRRFGPTFSEWTRAGGNHAEVELSALEPNARYVFVVVAIDEQGDYSRVFSFDRNMLFFYAVPPGLVGPRLTVSGDIPTANLDGGIQDDPSTAPRFEIPADHALSIHWRASAPFGDALSGFRWALDPSRVDGPGSGNGRAGGWSEWSLAETTATGGPFATGGEHRLYIEARTDVGLFTRQLLRLDVIAPAQAPTRSVD
jgi:hypothetical protein